MSTAPPARPRIAVLASGRGTNLQALIDAVASGALAADLAGVFSDRPGAAALDRGRRAGLPAMALDPAAHASRLAFDEALFAAVADAGADLVVCAGYLRLLSAPPVEAWQGRILNIHPSLLPRFKGLRTHQRALAARVGEHGASVHYVTPDLDGGPVIAQATVPVLPGDDAAALGARVLGREHPLLVATLQLVAAGRARLDGTSVVVDGTALAARFSWEPGAGLHDGRRMKTPTLLLALLLGAWPLAGLAGGLVPFEARYEAFHKGSAAGQATMRVIPTAGARWRIDLDVQGDKGLAGLAGLDLAQSTVFDLQGDDYRPVSQSTVRKAFFLGRKTVGTYDWANGTARWSGDVKATRRQPVALQAGDMSGLLINLAILRDAAPGRRLHYRYVDGGRVRPHDYAVSEEPERITVGDLAYEALRVSRTNGGADETIVWVADGVPTPVRILQREDGRDAIDLRLTSYKGVQ